MVEVWTHAAASPRAIMAEARRAEAQGWDGIGVVDSQNRSGDPYVALAMAASVTERIGLATAVTNSLTRTAAATASAIASVDRVAGGRAVLGIGRGDSAVADLGRAPARLNQFETYLRHLQTYLRGDSVPFDEIDIPGARPVDELHLADAAPESRINWIVRTNKVPVEVAVSGPRMIGIAALHAERLMFALGADTDRIHWGIELARSARLDAGLDPDGIAFGAYVNCVCHRDINVARNLVKGGLTTFARFSVMHGTVQGPASDDTIDALKTMHAVYDMRAHTRGDSRQAQTLSEDFIDRFAVVGPPDRCIPKLQQLAETGLDKLFLATNFTLTTDEGADAIALAAKEVLPVLRSG
ncbi:MAG: LLM class flavin-dependent oxidoreductase [Pseudomonadota bacterium]